MSLEKKYNLLYIDDDADEHEILQASLQSYTQHIHLISAFSYKDAEKALEKIKPQIVLLDLNLPGLDGYEILGRLRNMDKLTTVPIYIFTNASFQKQHEVLFDMGANGFYTKPYTAAKYAHMLNEILASLV